MGIHAFYSCCFRDDKEPEIEGKKISIYMERPSLYKKCSKYWVFVFKQLTVILHSKVRIG